MKELDRITIDPDICLGQPTIGNENNRFGYSQTRRQWDDNPRNIESLSRTRSGGCRSGVEVRSLAFLREGETDSVKGRRPGWLSFNSSPI